MSIYEPRGKAREYSPLALNIYNGCNHQCTYCYVNNWSKQSPNPTPVKMVLEKTRSFLSRTRVENQVLLCFTSDPYCSKEFDLCLTRQILQLFQQNLVPTAILTKAGIAALRDLNIWKSMRENVKVGATLTFWNSEKSLLWEPGAAPPIKRIELLQRCFESGIKTWASFEPVICPEESLALLDLVLPFCSEVKIGRWNHDPRANAIDWASFGKEAVTMCRDAGVPVYVKEDLRKHLLDFPLTREETNSNYLCLRSTA